MKNFNAKFSLFYFKFTFILFFVISFVYGIKHIISLEISKIIVFLIIFFSTKSILSSFAPVSTRILELRKNKEHENEQIPSALESASENEILAFAKTRGGMITAVELAANSNHPIIESNNILNTFVDSNLAVKKMADDGTIVYKILGFLSQQDKDEAETA